ncbi:MAG: M48 family metalloprotease [Treponema sp.]|nr:M48 family metalloprotease [Treponema sp.]
MALVPLTRGAAHGKQDRPPDQDLQFLQEDLDSGFAQMDRAFNEEEELSPEETYYLGRAVAANIMEHYTPYGENPTLTAYLNLICRALVLNSPNPIIFNGYHVLILDSQEINAFATSGGHILVTLGLLNAADSEDALAAVIAHEIAHIHLRHGVELIQNMRLTQDLSAFGDRAAGIASRGASTEVPGNRFAAAVREMVNALVVHGYAQAQEFEADAQALALLAATGYEPSGLIEVLQVLETTQRSHPGGFNQTHPAPALRIAQVEGILGKYPVPDTRSFRLFRYSTIRSE